MKWSAKENQQQRLVAPLCRKQELSFKLDIFSHTSSVQPVLTRLGNDCNEITQKEGRREHLMTIRESHLIVACIGLGLLKAVPVRTLCPAYRQTKRSTT